MEAPNPDANPQDIPDIGHAAATLATAADALSRAAQAIAEAALAMSDALATLDIEDMTGAVPGVVPGSPTRGSNIDSNLGPALDDFSTKPLGEGSHTPKRQEDFTRSDATVPLRNSPKIQNPSDSNQEISLLSPVQHSQESNNKGDPPTSAASDAHLQTDVGSSTTAVSEAQSGVPERHTPLGVPPTQPSTGSDRGTDPLELQRAVATCPVFPPGFNYIQLDPYMNETSVAAYLALQSHKTICIVRKREGVQWSLCAKIFNAITKLTVYHPRETGDFPSVESALHAFKMATSRAILLLACDGLQGLILGSANADCIVHWGIPLDVTNYVRQLSAFRRPVRSCLLMRWEQDSESLRRRHWDLLNYRIVQYPDFLLHTSFGPTSPYQMVREVSSQVLSAMSTPTPKVEETPSSVAPSTEAQVRQAAGPSASINPDGHYYIVLDETSDIDIVPFIAYIALHSKKTICYLPAAGTRSRNLVSLQKLIESLADLKALSSFSPDELRPSIGQFNSQGYRILLRLADESWGTSFNTPVVDSLIYWGVPSSVDLYNRRCSRKLTRSYLILTTSQHRQVAQKFLNGLPLTEYPSLPELKSPSKGSLLHDMRTKFSSRPENT